MRASINILTARYVPSSSSISYRVLLQNQVKEHAMCACGQRASFVKKWQKSWLWENAFEIIPDIMDDSDLNIGIFKY